MRFYAKKHRYSCGIDLHARWMYVCILSDDGEVVFHHKLRCTPEALLAAIAPYRDDLAIAVECVFCWYWVADLCEREGITFVLGHALYMKAIHGGKVKNDRIDALKIATLLRGGMLPQAFVYPADMRATRDLLRRRLHFVRKRGELLAHIQNLRSAYNLPELDVEILYPSNRAGLAEAFSDPAVRKSVEADLQLVALYDTLIADLELTIVRAAKIHDPDTYLRLLSIRGVGKVLALTILYEVHHISRFPRAQEFASYCRLVKCSHESNGKKTGSGGSKIGNVHLKWAFSEASVLFLRHNPKGKALRARLERKHGKAKALSVIGAKLGRAVYYMWTRQTAFDLNKFLATN